MSAAKTFPKLFSFSISQDSASGICMVSFNGDNAGNVPDGLTPDEIDEVEKLFQSIGVQASEEMENHYTMDPAADIKPVGDALIAAGLKPFVYPKNSDSSSVFPYPDGSLPTAADCKRLQQTAMAANAGGSLNLPSLTALGIPNEEDTPREEQPVDKAVAALNHLVSVDASAVKALTNYAQTACDPAVEDIKGVSFKSEGWGDKHQTYLTPLSLVNAAVYALTGKKITAELDSEGKIKFVVY